MSKINIRKRGNYYEYRVEIVPVDGKRCESVQASPEEIAEMQAMIDEIVGDTNE